MDQETLAILIIAALVAAGMMIYGLVFWQPPPVEAIDWSQIAELR
jgi:hypothetical protein